WGVEYLALGGGTIDEATAEFEQLLRYRNDVGLYAEEVDPETGDALGNFPQAFTHIGLINAALSIERRRGEEKPPEVERETPPDRDATSPQTGAHV
ncbi:MAG: glycoside hydrolase family 15 protein, partial [Gemmatimonadetes bacterium]|nr:glycoside hydrolase family 15 protein [Gemmatimonadota bacterium]